MFEDRFYEFIENVKNNVSNSNRVVKILQDLLFLLQENEGKRYHKFYDAWKKAGFGIGYISDNRSILRNDINLHVASAVGEVKMLEDLINMSSHVNQISAVLNSTLPIHWAVKYNNTEAVEFLISQGACINVKDKDGKFPLYLAVKENYLKMFNILTTKKPELENRRPIMIKHGGLVTEITANYTVNPKEMYNDIPLLFFAFHNSSQEMIEKLAVEGADIDEEYGNKTILFRAIEDNRVEIVECLIKLHANVNKKSDHRTPLFAAIQKGYNEIADKLIKGRADVCMLCNGQSTLFLASALGNVEMVKKIANLRPALINEKCFNMTPIAIAAKRGHVRVVGALIEMGADVMENSCVEVITLLSNDHHSLMLNPFCIAVFYGQIDIVKTIIEKKKRSYQ